KKLVQLDCEMELDYALDTLEVKDPEPSALLDFLTAMEFRTITKRVADTLGVEAPVIADAPAPAVETPEAEAVPFDADTYEKVTTEAALQTWIDTAYARGWVAVDTETTALNEMTAELVGISLAVEPGTACYIPLAHKAAATDDLFGSDALAEGQMSMDTALAMLKPLLEDPSVLKIGQNMKYDAKIFARYGVDVAPIDDTMLMSYAMNAGLHNHG
ncbi:MAG: DNA polymerase I, partial [Pseudomonadota bacterium]